MSGETNYKPCDLAYYTTWWLSSKPSISTQVTLSSDHINSKSDEESVTIQPSTDDKEFPSFCCIPIKKCRRKR